MIPPCRIIICETQTYPIRNEDFCPLCFLCRIHGTTPQDKRQQSLLKRKILIAKPDNIKKIQLLLLISFIPLSAWVKNTIPHAITTTTTVRIAVAIFELTPSIPIFASIDVNAANTADSIANIIHILITFFAQNRTTLPCPYYKHL